MKRGAGEDSYNSNMFDLMDATGSTQYSRAKVMTSAADFNEQKELFEVPEGFSLVKPPGSQNRSILFDYGLRIHRADDPSADTWFCMASEECIRNKTRFLVGRSTSTPADHLNRVHNIQTRKRIKKENMKEPEDADLHETTQYTHQTSLLQPCNDMYDDVSPAPPTVSTTAAVTSTPAASNATTKRTDAICWDDYFMSIVYLSAMRSKDPNTQVGACIVDARKRIVGIGYNGFPRGCSDDVLPWAREGASELDTKYPYVCHAEVNAILNKNSADVEKCSIYVGLFPCNECAKMIIQSGITEVVYLSDKYKDTNSMKASRKMFNMAGVKLRQYTPRASSVVINFGCSEVQTV